MTEETKRMYMYIDAEVKRLRENEDTSRAFKNELYWACASTISMNEWLAMLAEEATELAQAALKLRRTREPNALYTPKTEEQATADLIEEIGDVMACIENVGFQIGADEGLNEQMSDIILFKRMRLVDRMKDKKPQAYYKCAQQAIVNFNAQNT